MEKKRVIIVSVLVAAAFLLITIYLVMRHSTTGEQCPCHTLCVNGYTCNTRTGCYNQHLAANSLDSLVMNNCSAADGYVCCSPVPMGRVFKIRDPEMNKRLLPAIDTCGQSIVSRIIDGLITDVGQFPWMALLAYRSNKSDAIRYYCGGTLINNRYILTAAHCVNDPRMGSPVHVRLGELDLNVEPDCHGEEYCADPPVDVEVEKVIAHERYNNISIKNDIALLRLKREVNETLYVSPICLPFDLNITGEEETKYYIAGWGKSYDRSLTGSDILLYAYIDSVPVSECNEVKDMPVENKPVNEFQLCAGGNGKDPCRGDSGGPMMKYTADNNGATTVYQLGIVSFGAKKCGTEFPTVYTRVSAYLRWILANLEP